MKLTFITTRQHDVNSPDITIVDNLTPLLEFLKQVQSSPVKMIGFDKEFAGLNELNAVPLLTQIGNVSSVFVVDDVSFPDLSYLKPFLDLVFIGCFIKIDIKIARQQNIDIRNVYDVGLTEQRLGLDSKRLNNLEAIHERRLGSRMPFKDFGGKSFSNINAKSIFENIHIKYAGGDVPALLPIYLVQQNYIAKYNMFDLIGIEKGIIPIVADSELEGMNIDEPLWKANIESNKVKLISIEKELDKMLLDLGIIKQKHERVAAEVTQTNLFGFQEKVIAVPQNSLINYSSSPQVLTLWDKCGYARPTENQKKKNPSTGSYTYEEVETIGEEAIKKFNLNNPDNKLYHFIDKLIEYKETDKELSSFGEKFLHSRIPKKNGTWEIGYKNDKTGRVHTLYKQIETTTGRFSSGGSKIGFYNSQQIPKLKKYRNCFTLSQKEIDEDWWIDSSDLVSAEATIMCAFAKDKQLYQWAIEQDDLHSPMATACWQAVAKRRVRLNQSLKIKDTKGNPHILNPEMIISKAEDNPYLELRDDFKNGGTFGVVYGAKAATVSSYFNITKEEGQLFIDTMKSLIPDTFNMVEAAASFALDNGYLVFNTRTNSRKYFVALLDKSKYQLSTDQKSKIEGEARNARLQGTQADMLKEAIWKIDKEFREKETPNCMLLTIHDEILWKYKGKENGGIVARIMGEVGTLYLEGFTTMKASYHQNHYWEK